MLGGAIGLKSGLLPEDFMEEIRWNTMVKLGSPISPFNAWILLLGVQILHVRVERLCQTALALARNLEKHPKVNRAWYPGLMFHPQHKVARAQMPKFGGRLSFDVKDATTAVTVLDNLELCAFAASLGGRAHHNSDSSLQGFSRHSRRTASADGHY